MTTEKDRQAPGRFICLEGIDGCGKTTQAARLAERLGEAARAAGRPAPVRTREPGGTALGERVRALVLDPALGRTSALADALLMFAARAEHLERVIEPALGAGRDIVCERFSDATHAYQGAGHGVHRTDIDALERIVHKGRRPDLTVVLDIDIETSRRRTAERSVSDPFEAEDRAFIKRVRACYLERAAQGTGRYAVIDARADTRTVERAIDGALAEQALLTQ